MIPSKPKLTNFENYLLSKFECNDWMTREQIDPTKSFGKELSHLQSIGIIVSRLPHDFPREYALTDKGLNLLGIPSQTFFGDKILNDIHTTGIRFSSTLLVQTSSRC